MKPADGTEVRASSPKEARQDAFLAAYATCLCVTTAAESSGVARETHYKWLKEDPTYPERLEAARVAAIDKAVGVAYNRATLGGSDALLMFMLRGHSDRYRDKADVRHSGPGGGPIVVGQITDELRQATAKAMSDPKVRDAMMLVGEAMGQATYPAPGSAPVESIDGGTGES